MPGPTDSSPNFDFLHSDAAEDSPGWSPTADSAVDMAEPSETAVPLPATDVPAPKKKVEPPAEEEVPEAADQVPDAAAAEETSPVFASEPEEAEEAEPFFAPPADEADEPAPPVTKAEKLASETDEPAPTKAVENAPERSRSNQRRSSSRSRSSSNDKSGFTLSGAIAISLISYAVMMTILAMYALFGRESHQLESLPDRKPIGEDEFRYIPESAAVAPGHRLKLGDSVRFGNIRVEPLKVTRGTASLAHFSGTSSSKPPESGEEIVKMWLRLTNESRDQKIKPFDRMLVYDRRVNDDFEVLADQFVVPADKLGAADPNVPMYDLSPQGEWDLEGQQFPELKPGESIETFLAVGPEELEQLTGPSIWRILMRKGFNNRTGHGVLTLLEVEFDAAKATKES